jgi:hypothetical protein
MDALLQRVEAETGGCRDDDLAVDHDALRQLALHRLDQLGEVARERTLVAAAELDLVTVAEHDAAKAVPLGLEQELDVGGQRVEVSDRLREHRRHRGHDRELHGRKLGPLDQDVRVTESTTPPGWYADPLGTAEMRYWDGSEWTEHVSTGGVQSVAPLPLPPPGPTASASALSPLRAEAFTVERAAEVRGPAERGLDVLVDGAPAARFDPIVEGAPGYRLRDNDGARLLTVTKPGLKAAVDVDGEDGSPIGTITRVGRLHSRYDLAGAGGGARASAKLVLGDDRWEITSPSTDVIAAMARVVRIPADGLALAGVDYHVSITAPDETLQPLLVALPVAVDILDTQAG